MGNIFDAISGGIPGGVALLLFLLLSGNLLFRLLKTTKLISARKTAHLHLQYTIGILILYTTLWFALRPPLPPERIVIMPQKPEGDTLMLKGTDLQLAEDFQQTVIGHLKPKYMMHRWEWMMETLGPDSIHQYSSWLRLAKKLGAKIIVESNRENNITNIVVSHVNDDTPEISSYQISDRSEFPKFFSGFNDKYSVVKSDRVIYAEISENYVHSKILLYQKQYDLAVKSLQDDSDKLSQILLARTFMERGLTKKIDRIKAQYVKMENKDFDAAKNIIKPILSKNPDTPGAAYIIGRIALHEGEYGNADIYLKKAFIDDPSDCRIHYALSFLLPDRLQEIGYQSSAQILARAIEIDPGYTDAVHELANEYYNTGTGTPSGTGTTNAMRTMESFLKLNSDNPRILSLLGSVYLKISELDKAEEIFKKLHDRFPNDSDTYYNLGIVYYQRDELQKALGFFLKAIDMDQNLDSYLYAGVIYRELGQHEKALEYFRERVKRMTGEDDKFAKEAMLGIRKSLQALGQDTLDEN